MAASACRPRSTPRSRGRRRALFHQQGLRPPALAHLAALLTTSTVLGILYASTRTRSRSSRRCPRRAWARSSPRCSSRPSSVLIAAHRGDPADGIVKKNAIMNARLRPRRRCATTARAEGGDPRGLPAALPPDHDDHDGGALARSRWRSASAMRGTARPIASPSGGLLVSQLLTSTHAGGVPDARSRAATHPTNVRRSSHSGLQRTKAFIADERR